ncbi:conserved hypothetical protein [Archaeoglobus profundus DSM 5631]|uniref:Integrase SSV1 C-terminal domain-containing protein n=1 Tax=Archaeoglobus profundus (strain DSM 5631 / JCM 9629 / NBRC 100127 / Av18) TaxID=572546 RepID=D2RI01_ARCPA|nr:conserved hypothetical protein [Archaeoglobus profundus DSM 5631]
MEIDEKLLKKAVEHGIDLKTFLEVKLYDFLTGKEEFYDPKPLKYEELKEDFERWLKDKISLETAERYLHILKGLDGITPKSLIQLYKSRPANNVAKAIRNLVNYLEEKKLISHETAKEIRKAVPIKKGKGDKIIPTDEDVREGFEYYKRNLAEEYYLVALIIAFSGARLRHVLRMLEEWDPTYLVYTDDFARYEIGHLTMGHKEGFWIYMPTWLAKKIRRMKLSEETVKTKKITYKAKSGRLVTSKYIRKWFNNVLADFEKDKDVRSFIMGRPGDIGKSVEGEYYLELLRRADKVYPLVMKRIEEILSGLF